MRSVNGVAAHRATVRAAHPDAYSRGRYYPYGGGWTYFIWDSREIGRTVIGSGKTLERAWEDAAREVTGG